MAGTTLTDRALLRVAGDDPRGFLQGLLTNDLALLAPDRPVWAGLLTPQGKALFDMILWDDGDGMLIDVEAEAAAALAQRLSLYRLRRRITIEPVAAAVHWSREADRVRDPRLPDLGARWLGEAGSSAVGWREHRLRLGVTEGRAELGDGTTLWLEANARELNGVSFTKGCYIGQENTARMHHRAKVNRRLIVAPLDPANDTATQYPELGLMVERRRTEALGDALRPAWLKKALRAEDSMG